MAEEKFDIEIKLDSNKAEQGFERVEKSGKKAAKGIDSSFNLSFKSILSGAASVAAGMAAYFSVRRIMSGVLDTFSAATKAAIDNEVAVNKLNTALSLSGQYSVETSDRFQKLAQELELTTNVSAQTAMELSALALSYGFTGEHAEIATRAAIDFANAAGISTTEALRRLGRSISGSIGDISRFVPEVKNLTKEQLAAGEAAKLVLQRFSGSAASVLNTFSGQLQSLSLKFGSLLQAIGEIVTKSPALVAVMNVIGEYIVKFTSVIGDFGKSRDIIGELIKAMLNFGQAVVKWVIAPLEFTYNLVKALWSLQKLQTQSWVVALTYVGDIIANSIVNKLRAVLSVVGKVISFVDKDMAKSIDGFADSLKVIPETTGMALDAATDVWKDFAKETAQNFSGEGLFNFDASLATSDFISEFQTAVENAKPLVREAGLNLGREFGDGLGEGISVSEAFLQVLHGFDLAVMDFAKNAKKNFQDVGRSMFQSLGNAAGQAFAAFGKAIAKGENAMQAFLDSLLNSFGQMAIQLGSMFILQGIAYTWAGLSNGPALIAAGAALAAFGGILAAIGGAKETGGGVATAGGGSTAGVGDVGLTPEVGTFPEVEERGGTQVHVNIHGNVLDRRQTGLEIVEVISEYITGNDGKIVGVTA